VVDSQKLDLSWYLGEPLENRDKVSDVLAWWRVNTPRFPALGKMARDFLGIPISATVSTIKVFFQRCSCIQWFQALICGQDWLASPENN
jgi:hypothetical protein